MVEITEALETALRTAAVPFVGVSIGTPGDRTTWRVHLLPEATGAQQATAQNIIDTVDVSAAALTALEADARAEADSKLKLARTTVAYIWRVTHGGTNPTGAQLQTEMATFKAIYKALP